MHFGRFWQILAILANLCNFGIFCDFGNIWVVANQAILAIFGNLDNLGNLVDFDRSRCCKKKELGAQISLILTYSLLCTIGGSCSKGHIWFLTALDLADCQGQPMLHQKVLPVISFRWHSNEERQTLK